MTEPLTKSELSAMSEFLDKGCPTKGVTLSPWAEKLQADARRLLAEVKRLRKRGVVA